MKYSINGTGFIVAERDIYSLGGFIPKGAVGGKIASEAQLSQDGECWLAGGDISGRPDVVIKDNAYVGNFVGATGVHTDCVTEFSGNTLIPGKIIVRNPIADPVNNFYAKDSFIGISMDVLCGPSTTALAFPFEQGDFKKESAKGTLFTSASMRLDDVSACRNTATLRLGRDTYLYIPTGYRARVFWAYYGTSNQLAYSGESTAVAAGLTKLDHSVYKVAMVVIVKNDGTAMTPADLLATGAKILGHISGSVNIDIRPESASGGYVINNSSFVITTDNFGLATTQLRFVAGGMYDTNMYTKSDRGDYKPFGTFHNVERLEYNQYLSDAFRTNVNRDTFISGFDCPLLRISEGTFNNSLTDKGCLVLRRCVVPKAIFTDNLHNNNVYEDIDFSYANEFVETKAGNTNDLWSSHIQGLYSVIASGVLIRGFVSRPDNLALGSVISAKSVAVPLDGNIIEQGSYVGTFDDYYEDSKNTAANRVRIGRPLATKGANFPSPPSGFKATFIIYLREDFKIQASQVNPTTIDTANPYFVMVFGKADNSPITPSEFIALNMVVSRYDFSQVPEITGSAYVGAGCTVRGDVQLHGDPYVNRLLDVNLWEWGSVDEGQLINGWAAAKTLSGSSTEVDRRRFKELIPVEPGAKITCNSGYWVRCYFFDYEGNYISTPGWGQTANTAPANAAFAGVILKKGAVYTDNLYIEDSDIPLANVKYLRAFEKRRYITNELDRTSPKDILIGPDYWEQGTAGGGQADAGKTYEELKATSGTTIRLKRPINVSPTSSISSASGFSRYIRVLDAVTKFHLGEPLNSAKMALLAAIIQKDPSAAITPSEIANSRLVLEFVPQPRIIVPYGSAILSINGPKIRMYDNSVISRTITKGQEVTLKGDAVMGTVFIGDVCICSNGHDDAIIKQP